MVAEPLVGYKVAGLVVERDTSAWNLRRSRMGLLCSGSGLTVCDARGSAPVSGRLPIVLRALKRFLDFCLGTVRVPCVGYGGSRRVLLEVVPKRSNFFGGYLVFIASISLASTSTLR